MLQKVALDISSRYLNEKQGLEEQIAKYASANNLNPHQIEDLTNRVNREVISTIQKGVPTGDVDPHFTFETAKTANVIAVMRPSMQMVRPQLPIHAVERPKIIAIGSRPDRSRETIDSMIQNPSSIPDKAVGLGILSYMKTKLKDKINKYNGMLIKMDSLMRSLEKEASSKLMSGTPIEIIEELPVDLSKVASQVESWGHKLAHVDCSFEIDEEDPFVKMAYLFNELEKESQSLKEDIDSDSFEMKKVERIVGSLK